MTILLIRASLLGTTEGEHNTEVAQDNVHDHVRYQPTQSCSSRTDDDASYHANYY